MGPVGGEGTRGAFAACIRDRHSPRPHRLRSPARRQAAIPHRGSYASGASQSLGSLDESVRCSALERGELLRSENHFTTIGDSQRRGHRACTAQAGCVLDRSGDDHPDSCQGLQRLQHRYLRQRSESIAWFVVARLQSANDARSLSALTAAWHAPFEVHALTAFLAVLAVDPGGDRQRRHGPMKPAQRLQLRAATARFSGRPPLRSP